MIRPKPTRRAVLARVMLRVGPSRAPPRRAGWPCRLGDGDGEGDLVGIRWMELTVSPAMVPSFSSKCGVGLGLRDGLREGEGEGKGVGVGVGVDVGVEVEVGEGEGDGVGVA